MKRSPIKRKPRRDPVTPEVANSVLARDGRCVASILDPFHYCRDRWGNPIAARQLEHMTLDHVKDQPRMGVRAQSDEAHLVTLCPQAHLNTGWATSHRAELREYLARVNGEAL